MKIAKPINTTNILGKKRKKPKNFHKTKKDDENILSKDIDVEEEMKYILDARKILKPREDLKSSFTLKNLKFRPQKYKGNYLPYHLRWIFSNNVKSNEFVLLHEIEALENEISRLKKMKLINRECRKIAKLPFGICTNFCQCCHLVEKKKHNCSHQFCGPNCPRKKLDETMMNLVKSNQLKEKEMKEKEKEKVNNNSLLNKNLNKNVVSSGNKKRIFLSVPKKGGPFVVNTLSNSMNNNINNSQFQVIQNNNNTNNINNNITNNFLNNISFSTITVQNNNNHNLTINNNHILSNNNNYNLNINNNHNLSNNNNHNLSINNQNISSKNNLNLSINNQNINVNNNHNLSINNQNISPNNNHNLSINNQNISPNNNHNLHNNNKSNNNNNNNIFSNSKINN